MRENKRKLLTLFLTTFCLCISFERVDAAAVKQSFRKNHLDYLNVETLSFYLGLPATNTDKDGAEVESSASSPPSLEYDVAVLFYADWDRHSHALAPIWAQIAKMLDAGSMESKLIMGLFDCESSYENMQLCSHAGITHYPTMQYFTFSGQSLQRKAPKHSTKFGGNWQYGDAILDWIKVMRGLSQWHRAGWGKRLRSVLLRSQGTKPKEKPMLPVGLGFDGLSSNSTFSSSSSSSSSAASVATAQAQVEATAAQAKVKKLEEEKTKLSELTVRSAVMVESMLFPLVRSRDDPRTTVQEGERRYTDVFSLLSLDDEEGQKWMAPEAQVDQDTLLIRTCVQDMALDYCERTTTRVLEDLLVIAASSTSGDMEIDLNDWQGLQKQARVLLEKEEPYCLLVDDCILSNFKNETCRPKQCPFHDKVACRYLTSCLFKSLQKDYATALGIEIEPSSISRSSSSGQATTAGSSSEAAGQQTQQQQTMQQGVTDEPKKRAGGAFGL